MGVKDLWSVLTPHAERKPLCELRGKKVAIDLAGWICESLNVVDYFVHPRQHLKNLFFRTCYLIWEDVTPVFILEGQAPKLKSQIISKRSQQQFRGAKPKQNKLEKQSTETKEKDKGRTRFNHVLKQCETLLQSMGIQCFQAPGEAEAYCAFLNKKGLVDGVISQDSDCFAYGAIRVYRNFSVSTQGAQAAQGGAVDIYDMQQIKGKMDFGQNKTIVMALLCGCDYCPDGIGGIGRDGVLKLFNKYKEQEILERIRSWRQDDNKYTALEMRVDDKMICSNCGHMGRTQSHTKNGCGICQTHRGCDESLWKEERLSLKAELSLRKKAMTDPLFPSEEIIAEFLNEPSTVPTLTLTWRQPNIIKFVKQIGHLLQWTEIYCFQKFLPLLTQIVKKRTVRGVISLEIVWEDENGFFNGLIPKNQLEEFEKENTKGLIGLWSTIEPLYLVENAYPEMVDVFLKSKEKPPKTTKGRRKSKAPSKAVLSSLDNLTDLINATEEVAKDIEPKTSKLKNCIKKKGIQLIDKFFKHQHVSAEHVTSIKNQSLYRIAQCSTPVTKTLPSDLESDSDDIEHEISDIVRGIVNAPDRVVQITTHKGQPLYYEPVTENLSILLNECSIKDDLDLIAHKRNLSICSHKGDNGTPLSKRISLDDSFDALVNAKRHKIRSLAEKAKNLNLFTTPTTSPKLKSHVDRFVEQHFPHRHSLNVSDQQPNKIYTNLSSENENVENISYFFNKDSCENDEFEKLMDLSLINKPRTTSIFNASDDVLIINESSDDC
nr:flap endonuclease GEN isoform X2 [Bactrocera oleae]